MKTNEIGKHLLVDFYDIKSEALKDINLLDSCLIGAAKICGLTPLDRPKFYQFPNGGATGFLILSESHISLHTYPEYNFMAMDLFSCGKGDPNDAVNFFCEKLGKCRRNVSMITRGLR